MSKETGGQAFPIPATDWNMYHEGMTLRDYFAGLAMQGDWAAQDQDMGWFDNAVSEEILYERAKIYYRMAEAMLRARGE